MMIDLQKFFNEKEIPYKKWEIECNGNIHIIDSEMVIDCILKTEGIERHKIAGTLFRLDFMNASVTDYLFFLAKKYVENWCKLVSENVDGDIKK